MENRIKLKVLGITYSQIQSGAYALVLAEEEGTRRIPIIIGTAEAQSIAVQLEHLTPPRPLTHDLFVSLINSFGIKLKEVFIYRFEEGVFSAELFLEDEKGEARKIDSRTSDAISLALRCGSEIYTTEDIVKRAGVEFEEEKAAETFNEGGGADSAKKELDELNAKLDSAIKREDYEQASAVRDRINKLRQESNIAESGEQDSN